MLADPHLRTPYAARLRLPDTTRIHPVFHVSLLEHAADDPFSCQLQPPPPPAEDDSEQEYRVDGILDSRIFGHWRKSQYLVRWTGYDRPTWEDAAGVDGLQAIGRFHALHPQKPGPLPPRLDAAPLGFADASPELSGSEGGARTRVTPGDDEARAGPPPSDAP